MKLCIACGMPMEKAEDFPLGDRTKDYCVHCARPDGSMQGYDERLAGMTSFIVVTQGLDEGASGRVAQTALARLPAWKARS